ncbi:peroxisomal nicotinamide adenine dinucleotide carrier-like isoform X2 [Apium graveolens]|uniref:peroxisomal nicotinamide adenine dinucleotide carrier-like isoform X2 n=1 Tax=Apium graveolens TaxID=4045 RepID=UPI003D7BA9B5
MSDALINGLAGAGGGIVSQLITYPLQTVNTRQQTERKLEGEKNDHPGTIDQMCQVVKQEGWGRLYAGLKPSLVGTATSQGVYYYFYQIFRDKAEATALERKRKGLGDGTVGIFSSLVVAALSGCINVLLNNPIWVVVTRMQTHKEKSQPQHTKSIASDEEVLPMVISPRFGSSHAIQELYAEAGIWGFWKDGARGVTALEIFLLGALAKLGATVVTYPLNVVKSRLQTKQVTGGDKKYHYKGTLDAVMKMIQYEGFSGFYKGMGTKVVQSVLSAAVLFMIKEELVNGARWLLMKNSVSLRSKTS